MENDRYAITQLIGKGRTGGIYEAEDKVLSRKVALRRFYETDENKNSSDYTEEFIALTHDLGAIQHPELVPIFDAGVDEEGPYIITQLLEGERLYDLVVTKGRFEPYEVCDFAQQILEALATAHEAGFYHGALNPNSILAIERPRGGHRHIIMDLGLARLEPLILGEAASSSKMADPAFMAPEMFEGGAVNMKSDLYMVGQLCFYLFIGGHPYAGKNFEESRLAHQEAVPPLSSFREDAPPQLEAWVKHLTQLDPGLRPSSLLNAIQSLPKFDRPLHNTTGHVISAVPHATTATVVTSPVPQGTTAVVQASSVDAAFQSHMSTEPPPSLESQKQRNLMPFIIAAGVVMLLAIIWMVLGNKPSRSTATVVLKEPTEIVPGEPDQLPTVSPEVSGEESKSVEVKSSDEPVALESFSFNESSSRLVWTGAKNSEFYKRENWKLEGAKLSDADLIPFKRQFVYNIVVDSPVEKIGLIQEGFRCEPGSRHSVTNASLIFAQNRGISAVVSEDEEGRCTVELAVGGGIACGRLKYTDVVLSGDSMMRFHSNVYVMQNSSLFLSEDWTGSVIFEVHHNRRVRSHYSDKIFVGDRLAKEGEDYLIEVLSESSCRIVPVKP